MDSSKNSEVLTNKYIKIFAVVSLYWVVSISMVFLNKTVLGGSDEKIDDAPIFITWFQCVVTVALCFSLSRLANLFPGRFSFPEVGMIEKEKAMKVLPLTIMFVSMITFNNLCLKYVGVAFYYVGRSLSTVFNVLFSYLILSNKTPCMAICMCGVIIAGFSLGVDQEMVVGTISLRGVIYGMLAAAFVALNSIYTKKVLPAVDGSIWMLSYYNNAIACVIFLPIMLFYGDLPSVMLLISNGSLYFWCLLVLTGVFGFAIGYVTGLQIQVTSPLTHTISGTAKACAQTVLATVWYDEHKSVLWWTSNAIVLLGSLGYTRIMQLQMKSSHNRNQNEDKLDKSSLLSPANNSKV